MRSVVLVIIAVLLSTAVIATPSANLTLTPLSLYETTQKQFTLVVDNSKYGSEAIKEIDLSVSTIIINAVRQLSGWAIDSTNSTIKWFNGEIDEAAVQTLQFNATAGLVTSNKSVAVPVKLAGDAGQKTTTLNILVLDDTTPPEITSFFPQNGSYVKEGIKTQRVFIDAADPETGIMSADFSYWDCSVNVTNASIKTVALTNLAATIDLSKYKEGDRVCFKFEVENNALGDTAQQGSIGFDGTAPVVDLVSPDANSYVSKNTLFTFNATDNLAPTLTCRLIFDNTEVANTSVRNGVIGNMSYDMAGIAEGKHTWKTSCTDWVGWSTDSSTRTITIDKTPPVIMLNTPKNGSTIGDGVHIDIVATDNYALDSVVYSTSLNSSDLPEGRNDINVTATDKAGNIATRTFTFIVDRTPPTVSLVGPADGVKADVGVGYAFGTDDNIATALNCSLTVGTVTVKTTVPAGGHANLTDPVATGSYDWHVSCKDDAGNVGSSETRRINITDITGPTVSADAVYVGRTESAPYNILVTDPSGVADVSAAFNGGTITLTKKGTTYSGVIETTSDMPLGTYNITIDATDTYGNPTRLVDGFELIQGYNMSLALSAASVTSGTKVTASGTVTLDDGSIVDNGTLVLHVSDKTQTVEIINGTYAASFNAPSRAGTYMIVASIVSDEGFAHNASASLAVRALSSSGGGGGGSSHTYYTPVVDVPANSDGNTPVIAPPQPPIVEPPKHTADDVVSAPLAPVDIPAPAAEGVEVPAAPARSPAGVGSATSLFQDYAGKLWVWVLLLAVGVTLGIASFQKDKKEKINWDGYFERND